MGDVRHLLLYGGTFDPVHVGHMRTSAAARELVGADVVVMVPAWRSPHKLGMEPGATGEERVEMCRLAMKGDETYEVDDREVRRGGVSYTIDTVEEILGKRPGVRITLLMGEDQAAGLHKWHRVGELLGMAEVAVMRRGGEGTLCLSGIRRRYGDMPDRIRVVETPVVDVSATEIRRRVRAGESIAGMVPVPVEEFILARELYRGS